MTPLQSPVNDQAALVSLGAWREWRQRVRIWTHRKFKHAVQALDRFLPPGGVAIDIGAHEGRFALELAHRPLARVIACEPLARNARTARWTLKGRPNCVVVEAAISDRDGEATLSVPIAPGREAQTLLAFLGDPRAVAPRATAHGLATCSTRLQTLDTLAREQGLERLDFVKIDVEGHELRVLRGGEATIARLQPAMCIEISRGMARRSGGTPEEVLDLLDGLGYRAARLDLKVGRVREAGRDQLLAALVDDRDIIDILATPAPDAQASSSK